MKYTLEIDINLPLEKVIQLFDNPDNMKHWQQGLFSTNHISGTPGEAGAKMQLSYQMGKKRIEMVETILKRELPEEFSGTYETQGVWNGQQNSFTEIDPTTTRWTSHAEFRFDSFMMKVMAFMVPGVFKKQSFKFMQDFKNFAETGKSVA